MLRPRQGTDSGFALVELLVVMVVLGVVGTLVLTGVISAFRSNEQAQRRMEAMTELRQASERVGRELRAACPIDPIADDETVIRVRRSTGLYEHRFYVDDQDDLIHQIEDPGGDQTDSVLLRDLGNDDPPVFTYLGTDENGWTELTPGTTEFREVEAVELLLVRDIDGQPPVELETLLQIRNRGLACGS